MGLFWEGPEEITKNVFYWTRVATVIAQNSGLHREQPHLSKAEQRLRRRVWWSVFTRDRSLAVALGRPVLINLDDSDVDVLTEDDFIEDDSDGVEELPDPIHVQFFLQYVKLCEIMGLVLAQEYSRVSKERRRKTDLTFIDVALADWLQNCPKLVFWEMPRHHFWSALLHSNYYTVLYLLHRARMIPDGSKSITEQSPNLSRNIAFQAAAMITSIVNTLSANDQICYCPAFFTYSLFSALILHVYQMKSPVPSIQQVTQSRIRSCMKAMKEISRVWLVGKLLYTFFESVIGNKCMEEAKRRQQVQQSPPKLELRSIAQGPAKNDGNSMMTGVTAKAFTPPKPYERLNHQENNGQGSSGDFASTIVQDMADTSIDGTSFQPQMYPVTSIPQLPLPATTPDFYLVTRNSPNTCQTLWENYEPDQLFPESSIPSFPDLLPPQPSYNMDYNIMGQTATCIIEPAVHGNQFDQPYTVEDNMIQMPGFNGPLDLHQSGFTSDVILDGQSTQSWTTTSMAQDHSAPTTVNINDWLVTLALVLAEFRLIILGFIFSIMSIRVF